MKLSFSTLACPDFTWPEIYSMTKDFGLDGIEIRGLGADISPIHAMPFTSAKIDGTIRKLRELNIAIPCLSSGCALKFKENESANFREISEYVSLASKLSAPYIRVLGDLEPRPDGPVDDAYLVNALRQLSQIAKPTDVTLLVETNGAFCDTLRLRRLLDAVDCENVAALWDAHHPYRFGGEAPETTTENLGQYIRYVHVKDSVVENGELKYRLCGEGDIPFDEIFQALKSIGYNGFVSLEWVKRWASELCDAGIVVPHFANFMLRYREEERALRDNKSGTGKYIWPKETLIDESFPEVLDRVCAEFPDQWAFRYTECDYVRTYAEFRKDVDDFARSLIALGVKRGDHVAIWATNVPEWYISFLATTKIGAVAITVNTAYKIHESEYLLRQSDAHTLIMIRRHKDIDYSEIISEICPELASAQKGRLYSRRLPFLRNVVTIGFSSPGCYSWAEALELGRAVPAAAAIERARRVNKHDVCNMQYTSGTTGFPKGVMLTHYNIINNGKAIGDCMDLSTADRLMIQVPMFHCFGIVLALTACLTHGSTMAPITAFSPKKGLRCIDAEKITAFHGVPTMFIAMLNHPDFAKTDFSRMRTGIMAGSPCPVKVMQDVIDKMRMSEICITYGQTEAAPAITMSKTTDSVEKRVNTVGQPIFAVECKIIDPESGKELPDDADGEILARGYNVMKGYYKMPEATSAAIDRDGWLHTGDLGRRGSDGYYKITGRIKDMIIRGGENIYPKEIEDFIYTHEKVKDVQVIGVPDAEYGEEIMACVVLNDGAEMTEDELKDFVRENIARHKVPRYVEFVDSFPMNAAGKILKYKMRENATEKLKLTEAARIATA